MDAMLANGGRMEYEVQPLLDIHLKVIFDGRIETKFQHHIYLSFL